jgi:hypothetical protein
MNIGLYLLGAVAAGFVGLAIHYQVRLRRKRGLSRDQFAEAFRQDGVPYKIAAAVYDYYSSFAGDRGYAVSPDDTYEGLLLESEEDVLDDAECLVKQLRMRRPDESTMGSGSSPFRTIRDMVLWLNSGRQQQSS